VVNVRDDAEVADVGGIHLKTVRCAKTQWSVDHARLAGD